jgi:hypothetical protein
VVHGRLALVRTQSGSLLYYLLTIGFVISVSRQYNYQLRAGHKAAFLCTETTVYNYLDNLDAPKKWFKANIDAILKAYGADHELQKEDVLLGNYQICSRSRT